MTAVASPAGTSLAPVARRPSRALAVVREHGGMLAAIAVVLGFWHLMSVVLDAGEFVLPSPASVASQLWQDRSLFAPNVSTTFAEAALGFVWGVGPAVLLAVLFVQVPFAERALMSAAIATYCVPIVAIAPIVQVVFHGETPKVVLAALAVFFPTLIAALLGLRSADATSLALVEAYGGGSVAQLVKVRVRSALPSLFAGLRVAGPAAVLGAIIGEYLGGDSGLGVAMIAASQTLNVERVWALAVVASLLALAFFGVVALTAALLRVTPTAADLSAARAPVSIGGGWRAIGASGVRTVAWIVVAVAVLIVMWSGAIDVLGLDGYFAKTPGDVYRYLTSDPEAALHRSSLFAGLRTTFVHSVPGLALGVGSAVVLAVVFVRSRVLDRALMPLAVALQSAPIIAMTPLITLTFGRDLLGISVIVALVTFFPTLVNVMRGLRSAPPESLDVIAAVGGSPLAALLKVQAPSALPALFASLKIAIPGAIFGTVLAEWIATGDGLGNQILVASTSARYSEVWAGVVLITGATVGFYGLVHLTETLVLRRFAPTASR